MSARSRRFPWWGKVEHWAPDWPPVPRLLSPRLGVFPISQGEAQRRANVVELETAIRQAFGFFTLEERRLLERA